MQCATTHVQSMVPNVVEISVGFEHRKREQRHVHNGCRWHGHPHDADHLIAKLARSLAIALLRLADQLDPPGGLLTGLEFAHSEKV